MTDILDSGEVEKPVNKVQQLSYRVEIIMSGLFLTGFLFKMMHWPLAGIMIMMSLSSLSILYLLIAFQPVRQPSGEQSELMTTIRRITIPGMVASSIGVIGILFTILHWPNSGPMLLIGCVPLLLFAFLGRRQKDQNPGTSLITNRLIARFFIISITGLLLFLKSQL